MNTLSRSFVVLLLLACGPAAICGCSRSSLSSGEQPDNALPASNESRTDQQRRFRFHYSVIISDLPPETTARIWIPVAQSDGHQQVKIVSRNLPAAPRNITEKPHGNSLLFLEAKADKNGEIPLEVVYEVTRNEVTPETGHSVNQQQRPLFLQPNRLVPLGGKPFDLFLASAEPSGEARAIARRLYDRVDDHVKYDKPPGGDWGRGDAVWVCDSKYGNCSDFHSLFISLCRNVKIPAKFEIGFPIPEKKGKGEVGGYHCWAWFADGDRWIPVDISEADKHPELKEYYFGHLTADRLAFTTGRDLHLDPASESGPVNFLIYPHVEVDGRVHGKLIKRFRYEDLD